MSSKRRREMRHVLVSHGDAVSSHYIEHFGHRHGVPRDHRVGDQIEAECLDRLVLVLRPANLALAARSWRSTKSLGGMRLLAIRILVVKAAESLERPGPF